MGELVGRSEFDINYEDECLSILKVQFTVTAREDATTGI